MTQPHKLKPIKLSINEKIIIKHIEFYIFYWINLEPIRPYKKISLGKILRLSSDSFTGTAAITSTEVKKVLVRPTKILTF